MTAKFMLTTCVLLAAAISLTLGSIWKIDEEKIKPLGKKCCDTTINKTALYSHVSKQLKNLFNKEIDDPECDDSWEKLGLSTSDWEKVQECARDDYIKENGEVTWEQVEKHLQEEVPSSTFLCPDTADKIRAGLKGCFNEYKEQGDDADYKKLEKCSKEEVLKVTNTSRKCY